MGTETRPLQRQTVEASRGLADQHRGRDMEARRWREKASGARVCFRASQVWNIWTVVKMSTKKKKFKEKKDEPIARTQYPT